MMAGPAKATLDLVGNVQPPRCTHGCDRPINKSLRGIE